MIRKPWLVLTVILGTVLVSSAVALPANAVEPAATTATISCAVIVQNAHGSTHVTGTINIVSTVSCTARVVQLTQRTALYKVGGASWWGSNVVKSAVSSVQSNSAASCSNAPGQFYGAAVTSVVWPSGYVPLTPTSVDSYGATNSITCSTAQVVGPLRAGADQGEVVAVMSAVKTN